MTNIKLLEKCTIDEKRIKEIAQQSAKYLLDIFNKEGTGAFMMVCMLTQCCMERNEIAAYVKIRMYCRKTGHNLPEVHPHRRSATIGLRYTSRNSQTDSE